MARFASAAYNKSFDASGVSLFRKIIDPTMLPRSRAAASTKPLSAFPIGRMKTLATRVLLLAAPLLIAVRVNAEPWKGIVPLKSTRSDVERLLGKPLPGTMKFYVTYQLESEEVRVRYADKSLCTRTDDCECHVPDDTVLNVVVRLKIKTTFSSLELDMSKFHPIVNPENPNNVAYSNSDAGIMYVISQRDDLVSYVQYGPTARDCLDAKSGRSISIGAHNKSLDARAR